ncbi:hypothetical protein [Kineococcus sp. SYSU DK003]|uniref:hypothetical protein n=1 Tax=Kineococcus sp. SYSU DK003 TaxID=3383124 RepID=UPI003D7D59FA
MRRTTVGFSGSGASRRALRWAVADCAATRRPLHVVLAGGGGAADPDEVLADELVRFPGREPDVDVTVTTGEASRALLEAAADSGSLVLGCGREVAPVGPGTGRVLRVLLPRATVPVVLVGPAAVVTPTRRLLVVSSADDAVADWALERGRDLPLRLLTTWRTRSTTTRPGDPERRHAHLVAAGRHHAVRARLSAGSRRPVHADMTEGAVGEVVPQRLTVGDLVVVSASDLPELPLRTLRAPVVLVPAVARDLRVPEHRIIDLRDGVRQQQLTPTAPGRPRR